MAGRSIQRVGRASLAKFVEGAGVRYRKSYATKHTFITEMVRSDQNIKAVADYCGTSVQMLQEDYCGRLTLDLNQTILQPPAEKSEKTLYNPPDKMVAGPGFEPGTSRL